jgi:hypothetical protein
LREGRDANARARSALKPDRNLLGGKCQAFKGCECRADRERKLRARAEPGVGRDGLLDRERIGLPDAAALRDALEVAFGALPLTLNSRARSSTIFVRGRSSESPNEPNGRLPLPLGSRKPKWSRAVVVTVARREAT